MSDILRANKILTYREPAGPPPASLSWTCPTCGPIAPLLLPTGRYIRRSCPCERARRDAQRQAEERKERMTAIASRTYGGWLGEGWRVTWMGNQGLAHCTFANYDLNTQPDEADRKVLRRAVYEVQAFMKQPQGTLILYGPYGVGKTHLLASVCNALREQGTTSLFTTAPLFFTALYDRMGRHESEQDLIRQAIQTPFLVFDDLDKSASKDFRKEVFYQIIDERVNARLPIGVSTNTMMGIASSIGEAAYSRLSMKMRPVELSGKDVRPIVGYRR